MYCTPIKTQEQEISPADAIISVLIGINCEAKDKFETEGAERLQTPSAEKLSFENLE